MKKSRRNVRRKGPGRIAVALESLSGAAEKAGRSGRTLGARSWLNKRNIFIAAITAVFLFTVFGDKGLIDLYRLGHERDGILAQNRTLEGDNRELEKKIMLLKTDKRYIEHVAKTELGMIHRDEVVYKLEPRPAAE